MFRLLSLFVLGFLFDFTCSETHGISTKLVPETVDDPGFFDCVDPWVLVEDKYCYFFSKTTSAEWEDAQGICRYLHPEAKLAELETRQELLDLLFHLLDDDLHCETWEKPGPQIGGIELHERDSDFVWASGNATLVEDNWMEGEPDGSTSSRDVIAMDCEKSYEWYAESDRTSLPFICEKPPPTRCPEDFQAVGRTCYMLSSWIMHWNAASEYCPFYESQAPHSRLAELETWQEVELLTEYLRQNGNQLQYWIGASEVYSTGTYIWASTGETLTRFNWAEGQPDQDDAAIALVRSADYQWKDFPKTQYEAVICEADPRDLHP
ncbi:unnamed protein product [Cyprideis torosa]|uniref:Uncharacterized protein n=1 Tax=Cyprideis torosa TaxID=163714 RepID=A0A7R8WI09_9CRUS|nr:unnamed protein product [Cyprideis torosa]CAG0900108.1 unnamed protein product [Cyprideis torosa]